MREFLATLAATAVEGCEGAPAKLRCQGGAHGIEHELVMLLVKMKAPKGLQWQC